MTPVRPWKTGGSYITKAKGRKHFKAEEVFNLLLRSKRRVEKHPLDLVTQRPFMSNFFFFNLCVYVCVCVLGLHPGHIEIPRLEVESELQLPAYITATATEDPSCICDLYHSSQQCWIYNPLSEDTDWTCSLMVPSQVVSAAPRRELHFFFFSYFRESYLLLQSILIKWNII